MSDVWRQEIESAAGSYGLTFEALQSRLEASEVSTEEDVETSVAPLLGGFLHDLSTVMREAAEGSATACEAARNALGDLGTLGEIFQVPVFREWAIQTALEEGTNRLTHEAADLLEGLAAEIRSSGDLAPLRARDREWALLVPGIRLAASPPAKAAPMPQQADPDEAMEPPGETPAESSPELIADLPEATPAPPHPPEILATRSTLLIQEPSIGREFLTRLLQQQRLRVEAADNLLEAERKLSDSSFDLVIVDVGVSPDGGSELVHAHPELARRIVLMAEGESKVAAARRQGVGPVLAKPPAEEEIEKILDLLFQ